MWQRGGGMKLQGLIFLQHFLRKPVENILPEKYCSWIVNTNKCQTDASEGVCSRVYQQFCYRCMKSLPSNSLVLLVYF